MVAKSESPVDNGGKHPIIYRVSTILLVVQDFFHPPYLSLKKVKSHWVSTFVRRTLRSPAALRELPRVWWTPSGTREARSAKKARFNTGDPFEARVSPSLTMRSNPVNPRLNPQSLVEPRRTMNFIGHGSSHEIFRVVEDQPLMNFNFNGQIRRTSMRRP